MDKKLRYVQINETLADCNGLTVAEHIGKSITAVLPKLASTILPIFQGIVRKKKAVLNIEFSGETPGQPGRIRHWVASYFPILDPQGRLENIGAIVVEQTERKRAEAALRESEERFRQLAENMTEVLWMSDPRKETILYVSPAYEAIWGRTRESLQAAPRTWVEAIHADDRPRMEAAFARQAVSGYHETYRIVRPDGSFRWIRDRAFPIRNPEGVVHRIVGTAEDMTERHKLEEQLRQSQKMEAMGTLAGGIAHDFNNILAAIHGFAELALTEVAANPTASEYLHAVIQGSDRASDLVRQILAFSRQQEPRRGPLQLRYAVQDSLKLLRATLPSTITFDAQLAPDAPTVLADVTQIHQVLMNLGTNAWHAMQGGPGRLQVKLSKFKVDAAFAAHDPRLRPGAYARLTVADTGRGMDRVTLDRIFEPFFTTKAAGKGTGLGLSVVHGIVQSHEGVITVESQPGEGTVFQLYFPAHRGLGATAVAAIAGIPRGTGQRILLVDDEAPLVRLGQKVLERLGYAVEARTKPAEALAAFRRSPQKFALVITDQTMPGMTGIDFAQQVLRLRPDLPVILTTGYSASLTSEQVAAIGIRHLLLKPHTMHSLGLAVHAVLTGQPVT